MITTSATTATASFDDGASDTQADPDDGGEPAEPGEPPEPDPLVIDVDPGAAAALDLDWLKVQLTAALAELQRSTGRDVRSITLRLVDDAEMSALHERHRGEAVTTDVLTFELSGPGEPIEADVAACVDEALRRSAELAHRPEQELLLYVLHGLMHCAGFDDRGDESFARMHAEEDRILEAIGVGATFRREGERP